MFSVLYIVEINLLLLLLLLSSLSAAMVSHPPIPVADLSDHIDLLKGNDGSNFSKEFESIEPGQQFTWDNSNMEMNKPKNRYANVIAYDHSRIILASADGVPGTDYINSNYMDGYRKHNAYIATQVSILFHSPENTPKAPTFVPFSREHSYGTNFYTTLLRAPIRHKLVYHSSESTPKA